MKKGDLIIIPTDTVYGLAARLYDEVALEKIYQIKGHEQFEQIPILCSKMADLLTIAETNIISRAIMKNLWPGPLTIVLPTTKQFFEMTGEKTIAARIPNHPVALELIEKFGVLRATSVNKNGQKMLSDIRQIRQEFGPYVVEIYPQELYQSDVSSTVIDLTTNEIKMVREGSISLDDLQKALQNVVNHITSRESL